VEKGNLNEILMTYWPQIASPDRFQIGQTGVQSPVSISVLAGGQNNYSAILIDGLTATAPQRGIHIVVVDSISGQILSQGAFDTYLSPVASDQAAHLLDDAPVGAIVALVTYDEGTTSLTDHFRQSLASVGATETLQDRFGQAYALIGVKGAQPGTVLESIGPEGRVLDVGIPASTTTAANFESQIVVYRPNLITLAVQADQPGLLTVSEPYYPGWSAFIDGTPVPIVKANGMLRGIFLPANPDGLPRQVSFVYNPFSFRLGSAISLFTLLLGFGLFVSALLWRKK
jgi:hypothetical protein